MKSNLHKKAYSIRRKEAKKSIYQFALMYLSHHLEFLPSKAHLEIYDELTSMFYERNRKFAIAAPRNFGKSTLITLIAILYGVCYGLERFIVLISGTEDQSMMILNNVKKELTENERFKTDFPEIFEDKGNPKPPRWTRRDIITRNGVEIIALSWNQKIRGRKHGKNRPSSIFLDDIENADNTFTYDSRLGVRDWFTREVLKAGSEGTNFFFIGNIHHQDCLLADYLDPMKHPSWTKKIYRAIVQDPVNIALWEEWSKIYNFHKEYQGQKGPVPARLFYEVNKEKMDEGAVSLWPQRWDYYNLRVMYEDDPISFVSEMQNSPFDPRTRTFNIDAFHYWNKLYRTYEELVKAFPGLKFYAACDPSLGTPGLKGDYSAIVVLAKDPATKTLYVVAADIRRRTPAEIVRDIVDYQVRFDCEAFGYESNQFQSLLISQIEEEGKKRGVRVPLKDIKNHTDKIKRIQSLDRWVKNGTIQFNQEHKLLLEQMRDFPQGKFDDGPDALEMAVKIAQSPGEVRVFICGGGPRNDDDWGPWNRVFGR